MKIFLSYASASRPLAEELCHRLQAAGHEVFFDREDLPPGQSYDAHIREAIEACALFVFLVTPDSVADGRYTRTELKLAARRWQTPGLHVLPVLAAPTPLDTVPSYLRALNLLQPEGNLPAEVLIEVEDRAAQLDAIEPDPSPTEASALADRPGARYRTLTLRFEQGDAGTFLCLDGAERQALALDLPALEQRLWAGAAGLGDSARRATPQTSLLPASSGARDVGQALHEALFGAGSAAGVTLTEQFRGVDPQRGQGLRVVIDTTAAPALARLPWEFLYNAAQEDFVFSDRMKPLVRRLDVDAPPPTLAVTAPLRLLIAVAAPSGRPDLQVGAELAQLDRALAELAAAGQLATERLEHTTLERLDEALLRQRPHLLHFIGHGDFDGDEGLLLLEADDGSAAPLAGRQLAGLLRNHLGSLRLVFLNSCLGAASGRAAFGGVAQSLLRRGLPAVVAMQFPIADADALALARHFYRYLAAGQPVDAALTSARAFMIAGGRDVVWAAPALYMNADDGQLFELSPALVPAPEPAPKVEPALPPAAPATEPTATVSAAAGKRWLVPALLSGLLLLGGAAWLFYGAADEPEPVPTPKPVAVTSPSDAAQITAQLDRGDIDAALRALAARPPSATSGSADERAALAEALLRSALQASAAGRPDIAGALLSAPGDMPMPPDLKRRLQTMQQITRLALLPPTDAGGQPGPTASVTYTVRPGDTLWSLAARFLGDPARWRDLWQHHQRVAASGQVPPIRDPNRMLVGQPLALPPADGPEGRPGLRYHVAPGESLSAIAQRIYGQADRWPQIQQDNRIANPDLIEPGQPLWLRPPR